MIELQLSVKLKGPMGAIIKHSFIEEAVRVWADGEKIPGVEIAVMSWKDGGKKGTIRDQNEARERFRGLLREGHITVSVRSGK
jgi:hypothetical protein